MLWHQKLLARFTTWFGSGGGVIQTFLATVVVVCVEFLFPQLDKHGIWLLYWLTIYSAVTQPALAHAGAESNKLLHEVLRNQGEMLANQSKILDRIEHMLHEDTVLDRRTHELVQAIHASVDTSKKRR